MSCLFLVIIGTHALYNYMYGHILILAVPATQVICSDQAEVVHHQETTILLKS